MKASTKFLHPHTWLHCDREPMSAKEWGKLVEAQAYQCFYCRRVLTDPQPDHLYPRFRGGCLCCGNVAAACKDCNRLKNGRTLAEFIAAHPAFVKNISEISELVLSLFEELKKKNEIFRQGFVVRRLATKKSFSYAEDKWKASVKRLYRTGSTNGSQQRDGRLMSGGECIGKKNESGEMKAQTGWPQN